MTNKQFFKNLAVTCFIISCFFPCLSAGKSPLIEPSVENQEHQWSLRVIRGVGTTSSLGDIVQGRANALSETEVYGVELGRTLWTDVFDLPIDVSINIGMHYHLSDIGPSDVQQYNLYFKAEWTRFPWNDHLRTRLGVGEGISWVEEITHSELTRREGDGSRKWLNYLDFSLSLNASDLGGIMQLDHVFKSDLKWLDDTWLVANISHRSGIYGVFGDSEDSMGKSHTVSGGDNILTLGVTHRF